MSEDEIEAAVDAFRSTQKCVDRTRCDAHRKILASVASIEVDWLQGLVPPQQAMEQISEVLRRLIAC